MDREKTFKHAVHALLRQQQVGVLSTAIRRIAHTFGERAAVVRSSAPEEDRRGQRFAGLHASYSHVHGCEAVHGMDSLWSTAGFLPTIGYRTATQGP